MRIDDESTQVSPQNGDTLRPRAEPPSVGVAPVTEEDLTLVDDPNDSMGDTVHSPHTTEQVAKSRLPAGRPLRRPSDDEDRANTEKSGDPFTETLNASDSYDSASGYLPSERRGADGNVADPLIGMVIADRYRIIERIGRGGMGIVYRVEHTRIGKLLAMKLLAGELSTNKEVVRRFKQEALTVSKLSSPHTVQVFDYGVWQHLTYLVMELVEGQDLSRTLRQQGPMPFARLGKMMVQVCSSLTEAHNKGIVHRDIKPENIMVIAGARGTELAKVLDFGLAKLRESSELNEVTLQGAIIGTPYYMSPEQVRGEDVDGRTDIYSLGAVMYRGLTGHYPFTANTPMGMFTKHLTEEPPSIIKRHPKLNVPIGISEAVLKCMAKEREERFETIEQLRELLLTELNALGLPSSDGFFVSDSFTSGMAMRKPREVLPDPELAQSQIATREELEEYEGKLRRVRYGAWGLLGAALLGGVAAFVSYRVSTVETFSGMELEPNNIAADANALPLGQVVRGYIGRRPELGQGDRDFFAFALPDTGKALHLRIKLSALPNLATCSILYRAGFNQPQAQYCTGQKGQDLVVPAVRLQSGSYYLAVLQDRNPPVGSKVASPIHENVSDAYRLSLTLVDAPKGEVEPNDQLAGAQDIAVDTEVRGTLAWVGDEDYFCADSGDTPRRWQIRDGTRRGGTVLEATPYVGGRAAPIMRIHAARTKPFARVRHDADVNSPWLSPTQSGPGRRCVRVQLTRDPWIDADVGIGPLPSAVGYVVKLETPP